MKLINDLNKILGEGYLKDVKYKEYILSPYEYEENNEWGVEAYLGNKQVGHAQFVAIRERTPEDYYGKLVGLKGWHIEVHKDHRRKGLATAMYKTAEKAFKLKIYPGDFQTPSGKKFLGSRK